MHGTTGRRRGAPSGGRRSPPDQIAFLRPSQLSGVELLHVRNSARTWHVFNVAYAVATPVSWRGDVVFRHRSARVGPGSIVLTEPGDPHTTPNVQGPGSFDVLFLDARLVSDASQQLGVRSATPHWRSLEELRPAFSQQLRRLHHLLIRPSSSLQQQSALAECTRLLLSTFVETPSPPAVPNYSRQSLERVRDYIHDHVCDAIGLTQLESVSGVTRFHLVRAFKQAFGLPPHAYQACARAWSARRLLIQGRPAAEVATELGFYDQSHFIRAFTKFLGVTPQQYLGRWPMLPLRQQ